MIKTKDDLREYLACDKLALGKQYRRPRWNDDIWKFQIALRKLEYYYYNKGKGLICRLLCSYWAWKHHKQGVRLGFTIPVNACGKGLRLSHYGSIVMNGNAKVVDFCDIHPCVNTG